MNSCVVLIDDAKGERDGSLGVRFVLSDGSHKIKWWHGITEVGWQSAGGVETLGVMLNDGGGIAIVGQELLALSEYFRQQKIKEVRPSQADDGSGGGSGSGMRITSIVYIPPPDPE